MKKINHRERRESSACTGSVSRTAMLRGSVARPSLPPPPPSRDEHREHNQRHVVYEIVINLRKLARHGAGLRAARNFYSQTVSLLYELAPRYAY